MPKLRGGRLTKKQKAFANAYLKSNNATKAVIEAGYDVANENVARSLGSENLAKPALQQYLELHNQKAEKTVVDLMEWSKQEAYNGDKDRAALAGIALSAAKDIQDRVKGKAVQRSEVSTKSVSISIDLTGVEPSSEGHQSHQK